MSTVQYRADEGSVLDGPLAQRERPQILEHGAPKRPSGWLEWLTTTDHKKIGILYLVATFLFFIVGGVEALMMRLQLGAAQNTLMDGSTYNGLVSMHGTTMIFLFVVPVLAGFGNYLVPLMIGARDMAFPRLNALSFWLLLLGGLVFYVSLFFSPPEAGWTSYAPLSDDAFLPSGGIDAWILLIHLTGHLLDARRDQLRGHDPQHARQGHGLGPDAAVRVVDPDLLVPARSSPCRRSRPR